MTKRCLHNIYIHEKGVTCKQTTDCKTCRTVWLLPHVGTADRQPYCGWVKANKQPMSIPMNLHSLSCVCVWYQMYTVMRDRFCVNRGDNASWSRMCLTVLWVSFSGARLTLLLDCFLLVDHIFDLFMISWFVNHCYLDIVKQHHVTKWVKLLLFVWNLLSQSLPFGHRKTDTKRKQKQRYTQLVIMIKKLTYDKTMQYN